MLKVYDDLGEQDEIFFSLVKSKDKSKLIDNLIISSNSYNPSLLNVEGDSPLIVACKFKKWINAFTLLDYYDEKAIPGFINSLGYSAIYYVYNSSNLTNRLLKYESVKSTLSHIFPDGNSLLTLFLLNKNTSNISSIINLFTIDLLNHRNNDGKTALIIAAEMEQYPVCYELLVKGVTTSFYDNNGKSVIMYLLDNILEENRKNKFDLCLIIIEGIFSIKSHVENVEPFKIYQKDDFSSIVNIHTEVKSSYGVMKFAIEKNTGNHKIIKKYIDSCEFVSIDLIKEVVYIQQLNKSSQESIIKIEGIYIDEFGFLNVVFEPLSITLDFYFDILNRYPNLEGWKATKNAKITKIFNELSDSLKLIHENGINHNDIKLNNIMFDYKGNLKIIDFGISDFIGFASYNDVVNNYMCTSHVKAPDYGCQISLNIVEEINLTEYRILKSYFYKSSRKSYTSDIYSLGVSIIQGILKKYNKYVSMKGNIYKVLKYKNQSRNDELKTLNIIKIDDKTSEILKSFSFYDKLLMMIDINGNNRINRTCYDINPTIYVKGDNKIINNFVHYSPEQIKNQKYEMFFADSIFLKYFKNSIKVKKSINRFKILEIFEKILAETSMNISIDVYYNTLYNLINYEGNESIEIVFISYLYIFSSIFEWEIRKIEFFSVIFNIDLDFLMKSTKLMIISLLPSIRIIPFVLLVQKIVIKFQLNGINNEIIYKIEEILFKNLLIYLSGDEDKLIDENIYIWDFIQLITHFNLNSISSESGGLELRFFDNSILKLVEKFNLLELK